MTSPSCEEGSLLFSTELKTRKFSWERSGGVGMCISSVPRQNSTFPGVSFELSIPPLSPKGMGKRKWKMLKGEEGEDGKVEAMSGKDEHFRWASDEQTDIVLFTLGSGMKSAVV